MNHFHADTAQSELFTPVGALPGWTQTMRRATQAHHTGQWVLALAQYQLAATQARGLLRHHLATVTDAEADARVCAFVSSHRCLADLQAEGGHPDMGAVTLAQAHMALLALVQAHPQSAAWHRAAAWHCRDTHAAVLAHWGVHGAHPDLERALRAGCLALNAAPRPPSNVH